MRPAHQPRLRPRLGHPRPTRRRVRPYHLAHRDNLWYLIGFDLERVMRTQYRIDDFQESYFVIRSFDELFAETYKDFAALYRKLARGPNYKPGDILACDKLHHRGTHAYIGGSHVPS